MVLFQTVPMGVSESREHAHHVLQSLRLSAPAALLPWSWLPLWGLQPKFFRLCSSMVVRSALISSAEIPEVLLKGKDFFFLIYPYTQATCRVTSIIIFLSAAFMGDFLLAYVFPLRMKYWHQWDLPSTGTPLSD